MIEVLAGDCNEQIPVALERLTHLRWAPTFAFVDPFGMEFRWATLRALADHKRGYRRASDKPEYKIELWLLFPTSGVVRVLALDHARVLPSHERLATGLFGSEDWCAIHALRMSATISAAEAREEYVNLIRWRLVHELGYRRTHPLELKTADGRPLYHMVFATDNEAGDRIMSALYLRASATMPKMRREARDRQRGQTSLDLGGQLDQSEGYVHRPPWDPPSLGGAARTDKSRS